MNLSQREALVGLKTALGIAGHLGPVRRRKAVKQGPVGKVARRVAGGEGVLVAKPLIDTGSGRPAPAPEAGRI